MHIWSSMALLALALVMLMTGAQGWRLADSSPAPPPSGGPRAPGARSAAAFQLLPGIIPGTPSLLRASKATLRPAVSARHPARIALAPHAQRASRLPKLLRMAQQGTAAPKRDEITLDKVRQLFETEGTITSREELDELLERALLPLNPNMRTGKLANGLQYTILPNAVPAGRFEAHLQIMAGSADETQEQQGMAHMCEHVSYMGSRKRERLFGTSSQTNAQTDFHHTVYWAACPTLRPSTGAPMLPLALDALLDVLEARFETTRVEKERAAILSEAAMVNTIDYRVEVQLLAALHSENRLHRRFPIGQIEQIKAWTPSQVQAYRSAHYRPKK